MLFASPFGSPGVLEKLEQLYVYCVWPRHVYWIRSCCCRVSRFRVGAVVVVIV